KSIWPWYATIAPAAEMISGASGVSAQRSILWDCRAHRSVVWRSWLDASKRFDRMAAVPSVSRGCRARARHRGAHRAAEPIVSRAAPWARGRFGRAGGAWGGDSVGVR